MVWLLGYSIPPLRCIASSLLFIAFAGTTVVGCTAIQSTPQQQRENLAWSAEDTRSFARFVGEFVKNHQGAATDKTALLARPTPLGLCAAGE